MPRVRPRPAGLVLLAAVTALARPAAAGEETRAAAPRTAESLERLRSPLLGERAEAARELLEGLPRTRPALIEAFQRGDPLLRRELVSVLVREESDEGLRALADALDAAPEALARTILFGLARRAHRTRNALAVGGAEAPRHGSRRAGLERLLERAEVERLLLAQKSLTGGTGSYRGQYEALVPYRETALEVCLAIVRDRALPVPGVYTSGRYEFLSAPSILVEFWEVWSMAMNALADVGRDLDPHRGPGLWLVNELYQLLREADDAEGELLRLWRELGDPDLVPESVQLRVAMKADILTTLHLLWPGGFEREILAHVEGRAFALVHRSLSAKAGYLLRAGFYERAVAEFHRAIAWRRDDNAYDQYNLACAYASWSLESGGRNPAELRERALLHLERAVQAGWSDEGWMGQDRDLDPIRGHPRYAQLVAQIRERLRLPER